MKKIIAKGMAAFLMVLMALPLLAPICHAAEENVGYQVENHITHTPVKVEVNEDTWILTIKNQGNEEICDTYVKITCGDFSTCSETFDVHVLETYVVDLKNYFEEDFIEKNDIKIEVFGISATEKSNINYLLVFIILVIFGVLVRILCFIVNQRNFL